jgi:transmembrane sensor
MKDFRLYDITDFVMDEDFIRWVHDKSARDNAFWHNWLIQNPSKHLVIAEARQIVESIRIEQKTIGAAEIKTEIDNLLRTIRDQQRQYEPGTDEGPRTRVVPLPGRSSSGHSLYGKWARGVAALFILAIAGLLFLNNPSKDKKLEKFAYSRVVASPTFTERANSSGAVVSIALPDGSLIDLAAGSRISYPNNFGIADTRDVYLSGEAFFKIARNHGRPFRVFANEIITKVLGTSFSIRSYEKDTTIRVTVRTGKVSVYSQATGSDKESAGPGKPAGIIVTPNQQLVYQRVEQKFQKVLVEYPLFIVPDTLDHGMVYEDTPVEKVFDQLAKYYGINVVFDNELLSKCTVTADLANESFYHKLDLICKAIGAKYEIMDGQVVIQANGCQ